MANMNEAVYNSKKALPNKLLQEDGTITTMSGRAVINSTDAYDSKSSLPNKFLNPDGTYSTLNQIIAESVDTDLFIVVDELPQTGEPNKIYLLVQSNRMIEYIWVNNAWDPVGMVEFDINNYYTKSEITDLLAGTLNAAKSYANTNFLKKDNTTAFTPIADYHPATKKYVDDNAVTFKPFPPEFNTTNSTTTFLKSITDMHLPAGMVYLGQVSLNDMPQGVTVQAEVEVYVYPQNVVSCIMRSAEVSPYEWEVNSYENRGWEPVNKTATDYADDNFLKKNNTTAYTPTGNYNPATKKYVDDAITTNITTVLGGSY